MINNNNIQSICVTLPDWLLVNNIKKFVCIYPDIKPFIYNSDLKDNCTYISQKELKVGCESLNEIYMSISNIKGINVVWGDNNQSCWNYLERAATRELLVTKWNSILRTGINFNINQVKEIIIGVHLITQGCVSYIDPCSNLPLHNDYIDKRLVNYMLSDLTHCPIHN